MKKVKIIPQDSVLIDILADSSFAEQHIKGAKNFSVYEVAFLDKIKAAFPDQNQAFCLYGWSDETEESKRAYNLLTTAGYTNISILEGGLKAWKDVGNEIEKGGEVTKLEGDYLLNSKESRIEWTGRNIGNKHIGSISVKTGKMSFLDNNLKEGKIILDMKSLANQDLPDEYKNHLINHLKSDDFFSVDQFPEATIELKEAVRMENVESKPNYQIKALLTIKDITKEINFKAFIHEKEGKMSFNAHFDIDRTRWNVKYGSEKFFAKLGIHIIDDMISFDVILVGE